MSCWYMPFPDITEIYSGNIILYNLHTDEYNKINV